MEKPKPLQGLKDLLKNYEWMYGPQSPIGVVVGIQHNRKRPELMTIVYKGKHWNYIEGERFPLFEAWHTPIATVQQEGIKVRDIIAVNASRNMVTRIGSPEECKEMGLDILAITGGWQPPENSHEDYVI